MSHAIEQAEFDPVDIYLPTKDGEFRTVELLPSVEFDAPIRCYLVTANLQTAERPHYEAVSYIWGLRKPERGIILNYKCFRVSRNIEMMLRHFRLHHQRRTLWIDALCIDQSNIQERSAQIKMMREIYSRCYMCLAWLLEYKHTEEDTKTHWPVLDPCFHEAMQVNRPDQRDEEMQRQMEKIKRGLDAWHVIEGHFTNSIRQWASTHAHADSESVFAAWDKAVDDRGERMTELASMEIWYLWNLHGYESISSIEARKKQLSSTAALDYRSSQASINARRSTKLGLFPGDPDETFQKIAELLAKHIFDLGSVFSSPSIWTRTWTMQELTVAPIVKLEAGKGTPRLYLLRVVLFIHQRITRALGLDLVHMGLITVEEHYWKVAFRGVERVVRQRKSVWAVESVFRFRDIRSLDYRTSVWDVLRLFNENKASNPRDAIYGLLGLVTEQHNITIDYGKSVTEVFMDTTISLVNTSRTLDILCQPSPLRSDLQEVMTTDSSKEDPYRSCSTMMRSPSWVPDFSRNISYGNNRGVIFAGDSQNKIYSAGCPSFEFQGAINSIDGRYLGLDIVVLGVFENDESCTFERPVNPGSGWKKLRPLPGEWLQEYEQGFSILYDFKNDHTCYRQTGESAFQAYWRTLLRDCKAEPQERLDHEDITEVDAPFWVILRYYECLYQDEEDASDTDAALEEKWKQLPRRISSQLYLNLDTWRFAITDTKLYTMVKNVKKGDLVVVADGAKVPLVLRRVGSSQGVTHTDGRPIYTLVGTAYVHGFMDGEAVGVING